MNRRFLNVFILVLFFVSIFLLIFAVIAYLVTRVSTNSTKRKLQKLSKEDKFIAIDEIRKMLKVDPDNFEARQRLIDLLFELKMYLPAVKECLYLIDSSAANPTIDEIKYTILAGKAYLLSNNMQDAKKYFLIAQKMDNQNFDANFYLGKIEFQENSFEKAIKYFNLATRIDPENPETYFLKGMSCFNLNMFRETTIALQKYLEFKEGHLESVFYIGLSYFKMNRNEDSKKYLTRLLDEGLYRAQVLYLLGNIYAKKDLYVNAIETFEQALETGELKESDQAEAYYVLSHCYVKSHNVAKALRCLEDVTAINPNYKDVQQKIETMSQLNKNSLLEAYLFGSATQFTNICKLFVKLYIAKYANLKGKIEFLSTEPNSRGELEIICEVSSNKFVEQYYYIFFRSDNVVGDFVVRGIYNMLRENKIDKGVCVTAGNFSDVALNFMESRMLEAVEKRQLIELLNEISAKLRKKK